MTKQSRTNTTIVQNDICSFAVCVNGTVVSVWNCREMAELAAFGVCA